MPDLGPHLGNSLLTPLLWAIAHARPGTALEFGVAHGTTLGLLADAEHLDPVIGFDSFEGLPEDWRPGWERGKFACKPPRVPGANLIIGRFEESLPSTIGDRLEYDPLPGWLNNLSLVHIDCDLYSSTATVLEWIMPFTSPGTLLVFDEFHGYPGAEDHEARAWGEYVERSGVGWTPVGHGPEQLVIRLS